MQRCSTAGAPWTAAPASTRSDAANTPARKSPRSAHEGARELAHSLAGTPAFEQSRRERKHVEMLFAHLKRILKMGRIRLRGPKGARDEFTLAAIVQKRGPVD